MIVFRGGRADMLRLNLRRAPLYLRVVFSRVTGEWDALDQLDDAPGPKELVYVYRLVEEGERYHLKFSGKQRHLSGWHASAVYEPVPEPPDAATVRDTASWRAWCRAEQQRDKVRDRECREALEREEQPQPTEAT